MLQSGTYQLKPEVMIISEWRRSGNIATVDAIQNVRDTAWCFSRISAHSTAPISKGDIALIMEYATDATIRDWCRKIVLQTGTR